MCMTNRLENDDTSAFGGSYLALSRIVEKLLVERVVVCGIQLNYFGETEANLLAEGQTPRQLQYRAKRHVQADRMYRAALGALVSYQKLMPVPNDAQVLDQVASTETIEEPSATLSSTERATKPAPKIEVELEAVEPEPEEHQQLRVRVGV